MIREPGLPPLFVDAAPTGPPSLTDRLLGSPRMQALTRRFARPSATLFMLHRFRDPETGIEGHDPDALRRALGALRAQRVRLVSARELLRLVRTREPLSGPTAVFTVDDGYAEFGRIAAPIFAEFDCPVTVFVTTEFAAGRIWCWWDRLSYTFKHSPRRSVTFESTEQLVSIDLGTPRQRVEAAAGLAEDLKSLRDADRRRLLDRIDQLAEVDVPDQPPTAFAALDWDEIRRLEARGVEFGPHSRTHPILSRETDARALDEIAGSWEAIKRECRDPAPVFCYPNGTPDSFGARDMEYVRQAGMTGAVAYHAGQVDPRRLPAGDLYRIPRRVLPVKPERTPLAVSGVFRLPLRSSRRTRAPAMPIIPTEIGEAPGITGAIRTVGSSALWYTIAVLVSRLASLLMLPVYTRYLTPHDYGILQMLAMTSDIAAILLTAGMSSGVQRFYFKAKTEEARRGVVATAFFLEVGLALVGTLFLLATAPLIWRNLLGGAGSVTLVQIVAVDFSLGMLTAVPLLYLQTRQRAGPFVAVTLARLAIQVSLNLYFLVGLKLGVAGMLWSTLIANALVGVGLAVWLLRQTGWRFDRTALQDLRRFGVPNQVTFAGAFIITFGDRFFLQNYAGLAAVGLYALAYQFGFLLVQVTAMPFIQAWNPVRFQLTSEPRAVRDAAFARSFLLFNVLLLGGAVTLATFIEPALALLTTQSFQEAAFLVPIILSAYVIQSWMDAVKFGIDVSEKTRFHAVATWGSVVVTLGLYALLIPRFGSYGAAYATVLGFLVRFLLSWRFAQRLWPVDYRWPRILALALLSVVIVASFYLIGPATFGAQVVGSTIAVAVFAAAVWTFWLHGDDRAMVLDAIRSPTRALAIFARGPSR